ncbi:MAG: pyridoxamine 5'-phosphate oxidase family protein [Dehalococcoidia bacterium]
MEPTASRASLPKEYGLPPDSAALPWSYVDERMSAAKHYWLSTVAPDGTPHARPIDGIWLDGTLYFGGSPDVRWMKNLAGNPAASLHLEDAEQAVILDGEVGNSRPDHEQAVRLAEASNAKYDFGQKVEDYEAIDVATFSPRVAFAWRVLFKDATRFRFD